MLYEVLYLDDALRDYHAVLFYLSDFYPGTPLKFKEELRRQLEIVKFNPRCCPRVEQFPQFRKMHVQKYLVFYTFDEADHKVVIHRILHGSWDIQRILEEYVT